MYARLAGTRVQAPGCKLGRDCKPPGCKSGGAVGHLSLEGVITRGRPFISLDPPLAVATESSEQASRVTGGTGASERASPCCISRQIAFTFALHINKLELRPIIPLTVRFLPPRALVATIHVKLMRARGPRACSRLLPFNFKSA